MKPIENYYCEGSPSDEEICEAMEIASEKICVVWLHWFVKYNGWYKAIVKPTSTFDDVKIQIPTIYGM